MQELIASYLLQAKECSLPRIGSFIIRTTPSSLDVADKLINPPVDEILFSEKSDQLTDEFITYYAFKRNLNPGDAKDLIKDECKKIKEKLNNGETLYLDTIGSLRKSESGHFIFEQDKLPAFYEPANAVRALHKNAEHTILVGDKETTSSAMHQYLMEEEETKKVAWKYAAIVLLLIGLTVLFFHFFSLPDNASPTGNRSQITVGEPTETTVK